MDVLAPLLSFVLIATISPGGATTLATVSGANFGFRRSLPLIGGIAAGLASMAAVRPWDLLAFCSPYPRSPWR